MSICHICGANFFCLEDSNRRLYDESISECTGICRCKNCKILNKTQPYNSNQLHQEQTQSKQQS